MSLPSNQFSHCHCHVLGLSHQCVLPVLLQKLPSCIHLLFACNPVPSRSWHECITTWLETTQCLFLMLREKSSALSHLQGFGCSDLPLWPPLCLVSPPVKPAKIRPALEPWGWQLALHGMFFRSVLLLPTVLYSWFCSNVKISKWTFLTTVSKATAWLQTLFQMAWFYLLRSFYIWRLLEMWQLTHSRIPTT